MILCKLGDFYFTDKEISTTSESTTYPYATLARIANHPLLQDIQQDASEFTLRGWYLVRSNNILEPLKKIASAKKPIRFTTIQGSILVVITSITVGKKRFVQGGALQQEFTIKLKRWYP